MTTAVFREDYQGAFQKDIKPKFPPFSTLGVLGVMFVSMALKSQDILDHPESLLAYLVPLLLIYAVNFVISTLVA